MSTFQLSDYIALISALIALLAFGLTVWQGLQTRNHNRLSSKPFLDFRWVNKPGDGLRCELKNLGLGPAFLNKIKFFVDDQEFNIENRNDYKFLFEALDFDLLVNQVGVLHVQERSALGVGQSDSLLVFCDSSVSKDNHELIAVKLRRFCVQVEYKCIYGISYKTLKSGLL